MKAFERFSFRLILQLHPASFRERFGQEMMLDYQDALGSHSGFHLSLDLLHSLMRQWSAALVSVIWSDATPSRSAFLSGQNALDFQTPLSPYELSRGFMHSSV